MRFSLSVSTPGCHAVVRVRFPPSQKLEALSDIEEVAYGTIPKPSATDVIVLEGGGDGHKHCSESEKADTSSWLTGALCKESFSARR